MNDNIILYFNSKDADRYSDKDLTYYLQTPIILNEEYIANLGHLNLVDNPIQTSYVSVPDLEVVYLTNYGWGENNFNNGTWIYPVPGTDTTIVFEVTKPLGFTQLATITNVIWGGGDNGSVFNVNNVLNIDNTLTYRASDNIFGWGKDPLTGPLQVKVLSNKETAVKNLKIDMSNINYSTNNYFNSEKIFNNTIANIQLNYNSLHLNLGSCITLTPQIINSITFKITDQDDKAINFTKTGPIILSFSIILKKNIDNK